SVPNTSVSRTAMSNSCPTKPCFGGWYFVAMNPPVSERSASAPAHCVEMTDVERVDVIPVVRVVPDHRGDRSGVEQADRRQRDPGCDFDRRMRDVGSNREQHEQQRRPQHRDEADCPDLVLAEGRGDARLQIVGHEISPMTRRPAADLETTGLLSIDPATGQNPPPVPRTREARWRCLLFCFQRCDHRQRSVHALDGGSSPPIGRDRHGERAMASDSKAERNYRAAMQSAEHLFQSIANYTYDWQSWMDPDGKP